MMQSGVNIVQSKWISLPADGQCSFENFDALFEGNTVVVIVADGVPDVGSSQLFDFRRVGTGKTCHVREKALALGIRAVVVQEHRQLADWA
jgi:hypothetical protein